MLDLSVIVPTYCEADNLPELVSRIDAAVRSAGLSTEIIIVDDNSPDKTRQVCVQLHKQFPVRLMIRKTERGLASAVVAGMTAAQGEVLVCLDADLSHPPEKIPELCANLRFENVDFVMGSRYVPGARTDEKWSWFRILNSKIATWLARPLTNVSDPMAGFFAIRRSTFQTADALNPVGFKIALELIVKCGCENVAEVPIHFHNRKHGESKLNFKEQRNYLWHLRRLYTYRLWNRLRPYLFGGRRAIKNRALSDAARRTAG